MIFSGSQMDQQAYLKLISGKSQGPIASILHFILKGFAFIYFIVISFRSFLYSKGWLKTHQVSAIVISIGNITTGGTGKTPLVIWLCNLLSRKDVQYAILTRGYKSVQNSKLESEGFLDEPAILIDSCPEAKVIVNPDRVIGAFEAIKRFGTKVLIMDDGFQHRRLARDLDIIIIDATCPFGYGVLLPAGLLREPVGAIKRADAIVITRCDQISQKQLSQLEHKLRRMCPDKIIAKAIHEPIYAESKDSTEINISKLTDKKIYAFCGIGNSEAFFNTLKTLDSNLVGSRVFNDHYHYTDGDIADICKQAKDCEAEMILTTRKDWTKIARLILANNDMLFASLVIKIEFLSGEDKLIDLIENTLECKIS